MKESAPEHWIRIHETNASYEDMFDNFADVLGDMGIDCQIKDDELSSENGLFIVLEKFEDKETQT